MNKGEKKREYFSKKKYPIQVERKAAITKERVQLFVEGYMSIILEKMLQKSSDPKRDFLNIQPKAWSKTVYHAYELGLAAYNMGVDFEVFLKELMFEDWIPPTEENGESKIIIPGAEEILNMGHASPKEMEGLGD